MDTIGLDLHKRESRLAMGRRTGPSRTAASSRAASEFTAVLGGRPRARILLEASTESEWVARHLEQLGHEVIVADPNFAPMYATRSRRTKTDRRDARTLMEACRLGAYRPAYRLSDARRHVRAELAVREASSGRAPAVHPSPRRSCGATASACRRATAAWCRRRSRRSHCHRRWRTS